MLLKPITKLAPCPTCKGSVFGRSDKRFCCLKCKNEHHRVARIQIKSHYEEINRKIQRNLVVVEGILGQTFSCMSIHKDALFKYGFDVSVCTSVSTTENITLYKLGDYSYSLESDGIVMVKRNNKLSLYMPVFFERWAIDFPEDLTVNNEFLSKNKSVLQSKLVRWNE